MRTKQELYQAALRTVALRRQTARANAEDARLEAEAAIPALRHAEDEVRVRGIRCALAGAAGKDTEQSPAGAHRPAGRQRPPRGCAGAQIHLQAVPGYRQRAGPHLHLRSQADAGSATGGDRGAVQPVHFQF